MRKSIPVPGTVAIALVLVIPCIACMGTRAGRGPSAQRLEVPSKASAVTDPLAGRWSVVEMRSDVPLIKEAGQIALMIVAAMDVELADSEIIVRWGNERRRVGRRVRHADRWTIADTSKGDLIFGGATLHRSGGGGLELRRKGDTLVLARDGARSYRRAVCWSVDQYVVAVRESCSPGEKQAGALR